MKKKPRSAPKKIGALLPTMEPSYLELYRSGELAERVGEGLSILRKCTLCPRCCGVNRTLEAGACRTGRLAQVSSFNAHHGEEPPLSGSRGSGTVFFTNCNMRCLYCQNYPISQMGHGHTATADGLARMMLDLARRGCHNLNLVTPSHLVPQILEALLLAIPQGFRLPIVYNTSGYDALETLALLDGVVDIYLPDMRYADEDVALQLSGVGDYVARNREAVQEMARQAGELQLDEEGIAKRGLIIRHLLLPDGLAGTRETFRFIAEELSPTTTLSVMAQYFPAHRANDHPALCRSITNEEYAFASRCLEEFGLENGWQQGL
jgi:putative pyruvate formate lyase activating enzyme